MKKLISVAVLAACAGLAGCGEEEPKKTSGFTDIRSQAAKDEEARQKAEAAKQDAEQKAREAAAPRGDKAKALTEYQELDSGKQLMFLNLALSGMPVQYEEVAALLSDRYQRESDSFKKNDILNALKPGIDQEIASAKEKRYFYMDITESPIDTYDFAQKAFPLKLVSSDSYRYFFDAQNYKAHFTHTEPFATLKVEDETVAREIEQLRTKYKQLHARLYMFAMDVPLASSNVRFEPMVVELRDANKRVIATVTR